MEREHMFTPGSLAQHFKRRELTAEQLAQEPQMYLYEIVGVAEHTESGEALMIYRPLYGQQKLYARPLAMFLSEVDRDKYPNAKQNYRFERYEEDAP